MKRSLVGIAFLLVLVGVAPARADSFSLAGDLNRGTTTGVSSPLGPWTVHDGIVARHTGGDRGWALVDEPEVDSQPVLALLTIRDSADYGGVALWYQGPNDGILVRIYPYTGGIASPDRPDGTGRRTLFGGDCRYARWCDGRDDPESLTGGLSFYAGGAYLFRYTGTPDYRVGPSEFNHGDSGGYFGYFRWDRRTLTPIPEPASLLLFGAGLAGLRMLRRRRR